MPVWHEATKKLQEEGRLQLVGIIQEQHPDRCRLFMQWKQMSWPVLWDPVNSTDVTSVPLAWAIDEHGIVRAVNPAPETIEETFVSRAFPEPPRLTESRPPSLSELEARSQTAEGARAYADALLLGKGDLDEAIEAYRQAVRLDPGDGRNHFRLGVALRAQFDSAAKREGDFQEAIEEWTTALSLDPNQYIWRRRIQQYGPRLDKPYPFFDWVEEARRDIRARGEEPYPLRVEPRGSEIASPHKSLSDREAPPVPDPEGRVHHDPGPHGSFIRLEPVVVPALVTPGEPLRLHLMFQPNQASHWNNEAEPLRVWLDVPKGWKIDAGMQEFLLPAEGTSNEVRTVEFELVVPEQQGPGSVKIPVHAFYYVCKSDDGTCLYRRRDADVEVKIGPK